MFSWFGRSADPRRDLIEAVVAEDEARVGKLLKKNADSNAVDDRGVTALHIACSRGFYSIAQLLIESGANVSAVSPVGYTPLMAAANNQRLPAIRLLLEKGADINLSDSRERTALHWAMGQRSLKPDNQKACIHLLIKAGADVNSRDEDGITPLMEAAWFGIGEGVQVLLNAGADKSLLDNSGRSAYKTATSRGHCDVAEMLRE